MITAAVLTISDKGAAGQREDASGALVADMLAKAGYAVEKHDVVPDDEQKIAKRLIDWVDRDGIRLIVTTGGTGVSPTDVTPEAMLRVIEFQVPGIAEAMRAESMKKTPHAMLSRAMAGVRKTSLIINLPGSPAGAQENLAAVLPALSHGLEKIGGNQTECAQ